MFLFLAEFSSIFHPNYLLTETWGAGVYFARSGGGGWGGWLFFGGGGVGEGDWYKRKNTVKPLFRGRPRDKEKCPLNGGVPLLEVTSTKIIRTIIFSGPKFASPEWRCPKEEVQLYSNFRCPEFGISEFCSRQCGSHQCNTEHPNFQYQPDT